MSKDRGIYPKYVVFKHPEDDIQTFIGHVVPSNGGPSYYMDLVDDFVFVLKPISDPHARVALAAYAQSVSTEKPQLAADIKEVLSDF